MNTQYILGDTEKIQLVDIPLELVPKKIIEALEKLYAHITHTGLGGRIEIIFTPRDIPKKGTFLKPIIRLTCDGGEKTTLLDPKNIISFKRFLGRDTKKDAF